MLAFHKARKGKGWQKKVKKVEANLESYIDKLHDTMNSGNYHTSSYTSKVIFEPKMRTIYILPFYPDRIVHHAIMNILEPIWDNLFIHHSYACRVGRGQHKGSKYCMELVRKYKYCLKCDVSKFYPSINHEILKKIVRKKLKDQKLLTLLDEIIDSIEGETNVPIGNYLSQWFGNLYLNELDQLLKHKYHIKNYLRYCDDFLLFSNSKEELHKMADVIKEFLEGTLKLRMSKCDLFPVSRGVDFLGYRHFPEGYILVRKTTAKRMKKRMRGIIWEYKHHKISKLQAQSKIASTEGWLKYANTYNLSMSLKIKEIKECINNDRLS
jgi:retron-type reverse transcriptase